MLLSDEGTEHSGNAADVASMQLTYHEHFVSERLSLEQHMSLFLVGFGSTGVINHIPTTITIIGLTGLRGLVGLTTGWIDPGMAQGD
jgi:hypothetical protein